MNSVEESLRLLEDAVKKRCSEGKIGLIYSAGIDSTLVGVLASKYCQVEAYSVGIKDSHDLDYASQAKDKVPFNVNLVEVSQDEIEKELPRIVKLIGNANPLNAAVAIPFYFAAKKASEEGLKIVLCGQGADELFGGYNKYIELLGKENYKAVEELMRKDLEELPDTNLWRDTKMCENFGLKLEAPFLDEKFIEFVQKIPVEEKIKENKGEYECTDEVEGRKLVRKYVLRKMSEVENLPKEIVHRVKKAAQYGSGSQKTIEKLARKNGFKKKAAEKGRKDYQQMYLESML